MQVETQVEVSKGDIVMFGRPNGEKTKATVLKVNGKSLLVETLEERGLQRVRGAGRKWRIPNNPMFFTVVGKGGF